MGRRKRRKKSAKAALSRAQRKVLALTKLEAKSRAATLRAFPSFESP